jgi:hypothetical protein
MVNDPHGVTKTPSERRVFCGKVAMHFNYQITMSCGETTSQVNRSNSPPSIIIDDEWVPLPFNQPLVFSKQR